jgi:hypothetical protein
VVTGLRIYFAGILLAIALSLVELTFALADTGSIRLLGHVYLVWLAYGACGFIALLSLVCSANVRLFVLYLGILPPVLVGFYLFLLLYPVYLPFPVILVVGLVKAGEEASKASRA